MSKFSILGRFLAKQIPSLVPPDYRGRIRAVTQPEAPYTVVLFEHDREDVVTSPVVHRALARIPTEESLLAVGAVFTVEATQLLNERRAAIANIGEFYWTDESWTSRRQ